MRLMKDIVNFIKFHWRQLSQQIFFVQVFCDDLADSWLKYGLIFLYSFPVLRLWRMKTQYKAVAKEITLIILRNLLALRVD